MCGFAVSHYLVRYLCNARYMKSSDDASERHKGLANKIFEKYPDKCKEKGVESGEDLMKTLSGFMVGSR